MIFRVGPVKRNTLYLLLKMRSQQNVKDLMFYLFLLLCWIKPTFACLFPCGEISKILTHQYNEDVSVCLPCGNLQSRPQLVIEMPKICFAFSSAHLYLQGCQNCMLQGTQDGKRHFFLLSFRKEISLF